MALGRAMPPGTAKMYGATGEYIGLVQSRGSTAVYYDNFGRLNARSERVDSTMHFYDATGRHLGYSRARGGNRIDFHTPEGELVGYEVLDGGRILWHFEADGTVLGYTILSKLDLAALGVASDAFVFSLPAAATAALLGGSDKHHHSEEPSIQEDQSIKPLSPKVVRAADTLVNAGNRCRTEGHLESCRDVSPAYADLSEALREEIVRLSRPEQKKQN
jgi:hypothetical protein